MKTAYASRKGQTLIEFALIMPLLLVLAFGIIEFGIFLYNQQVITNASREGVRHGIVARIPRVPISGTDSINTVVQTYCANHLRTFAAQNIPVVQVTGYDPNALFGANLTVTVTYNYTFILSRPFTPKDRTKTLVATTVMKYE
jgi:Flp pilus assembly protein TadG